jgi:hypothetical protein
MTQRWHRGSGSPTASCRLRFWSESLNIAVVGQGIEQCGRHLGRQQRRWARRPHSSLDGATPDQAYFTPLPIRMAT